MRDLRALRHLLDPRRPLTYGIVQAGDHVPDGIPYIRPVDMSGTSGVLDQSQLLRTSVDIARQYERAAIRADDVVMSIGPSFGKVMLVPSTLEGANLTQGTARLAPGPDLEPRWLYWWLQSEPARQFWDASVSGATFRALNLGPLGETPTPLVPIEEQRRIAEFLDDQVARIDAAVESCDKQIEWLDSLKRSVITAAVTGANATDGHQQEQPDARRDQSTRTADSRPHAGPCVSWSRTPLKRLSKAPLVNGLGLPGEHDNPSWPRYIRTTDIESARSLRPDTFASQPPEIAKKAGVEPGDILMTAAGTIGKSVLIEEEIDACYAGFLVRFRPNDLVVGRFISYWMQSADYWAQIDTGAVRSTIDNFSASKYQNLRVPLPSLDEQWRIVDFLDGQVARIDSGVAAQRERKKLLHELERSLITAAVTGELDVAAARRGVPE